MNCFYCSKDERLYENRIPLGVMRVSTLYLTRDQRYLGRCIVAFQSHKEELYDLSQAELIDFMLDITDVAQAIHSIFGCDKINYAIYGDNVPHLHMHVVPKYRDGSDWGTPFSLNSPRILLDDAQYEDIAQRLRSMLPVLK